MRNLFPDPYITYDISDPDLQLRMDRHQMVQVLINLVKNGVEACSDCDAPSIIVSARADHPGRRFVISVADNGCGISPEALDSIFVPFYTTKPGGSCIGLSLSRQIVSAHGGSLELIPAEKGTEFRIVLPLIYRL